MARHLLRDDAVHHVLAIEAEARVAALDEVRREVEEVRDWLVHPDPAPPPGWVLPDGYEFVNLGTCKGCSARIMWCTTPVGRRAPVDRDGTSHFATCPDRDQFRRARATGHRFF
jgi:hypothetical protein